MTSYAGYPPATTAAPQPQDLTANGFLAGVEPRQSGWYRFSIQDPNRQYPLKLDTKQPEIVQQALALMGQPVTVAYREQESPTINPHNGRPYVNRYLNTIAMQGAMPSVGPSSIPPQPAAPQTTSQGPLQPFQQQQRPPVQPGIQGFDKDINIMRQTASKISAVLWSSLPVEQRTLQTFVETCESMMAYYVYGPARFGVTAFSSPQPPSTMPNPQNGSNPGDAQQQAMTLPDGSCVECGYPPGQHAQGCPSEFFT